VPLENVANTPLPPVVLVISGPPLAALVWQDAWEHAIGLSPGAAVLRGSGPYSYASSIMGTNPSAALTTILLAFVISSFGFAGGRIGSLNG
jgi:hypothetical protein